MLFLAWTIVGLAVLGGLYLIIKEAKRDTGFLIGLLSVLGFALLIGSILYLTKHYLP